MSSPKPSIIVIPGACGLPEFYDSVVDPVAAKGYDIKAVHLPTLGLKLGPQEGAPGSIYDDAAFIAKKVEALADQGKDVILIAHSYGGVPTTQCTEGLSKAERKAAGKQGGIIRLAYMTCLVPAVGETGGAVLMDVPKEKEVGLVPDVRPPLHTLPLNTATDNGRLKDGSIMPILLEELRCPSVIFLQKTVRLGSGGCLPILVSASGTN